MDILIVDDEPMIRKGLQTMVAQLGTQITSIRLAGNGEEALAQIQAGRPDILLTDIRMPKLDGLELCRQVAQMDTDMVVVVVSGYHDFEYAQKCLSYGVKEYILKPVNKKKLHEVLLQLIFKLQKQRAVARLTTFNFDPWVEQMDEAIWNVQEEALDTLFASLRSETAAFSTQKPLTDLLHKLHAQLSKKLQSRDINLPGLELPIHNEESMSAASEAGSPLEPFIGVIRATVKELRLRRKGKHRDPIEEAKAYIEKHIAKEVSLEEVAETLGFNASYFSQLFKQMTNETFVQYRIKRRMERAKKLLEQPHYRIVDISYEIGYADHAHFTKTFKKYEGCSPSEYRGRLGIH
jgi:two-component system response regulator YesN